MIKGGIHTKKQYRTCDGAMSYRTPHADTFSNFAKTLLTEATATNTITKLVKTTLTNIYQWTDECGGELILRSAYGVLSELSKQQYKFLLSKNYLSYIPKVDENNTKDFVELTNFEYEVISKLVLERTEFQDLISIQ